MATAATRCAREGDSEAKWTDIDWDRGTIFIGLTKNGEAVLVTLRDAALARLRIIPRIRSNPYLICGRKRGRPLHALGVVLQRVVRHAELTNLRVHDLRRTVGSWLAHAGASLQLIGDVLNHLDLKTTLGYAYFQAEHRRTWRSRSSADGPLYQDPAAA